MPADQVVVAAVIVRDGRLLAARRSAPAPVAGGWELPGGKVDGGETPQEALSREIREELGIEVEAVRRLGGDQPLAPGRVLQAWVVRLLDDAEPRPLEDHDALRWLSAAELDDVAWLPADLPFVAAARELLGE